jgi:hypothetical protein
MVKEGGRRKISKQCRPRDVLVGDVTWGQAGKERERHMPRQASKKHSARLCRDTSHACTKSRVAASTRSFACVVCAVGLLSVSAKKKRERQGRVAMLEIDFRFQTPNCPTRAISPSRIEHRTPQQRLASIPRCVVWVGLFVVSTTAPSHTFFPSAFPPIQARFLLRPVCVFPSNTATKERLATTRHHHHQLGSPRAPSQGTKCCPAHRAWPDGGPCYSWGMTTAVRAAWEEVMV